jgi:hypothetical protein
VRRRKTVELPEQRLQQLSKYSEVL